MSPTHSMKQRDGFLFSSQIARNFHSPPDAGRNYLREEVERLTPTYKFHFLREGDPREFARFCLQMAALRSARKAGESFRLSTNSRATATGEQQKKMIAILEYRRKLLP